MFRGPPQSGSIQQALVEKFWVAIMAYEPSVVPPQSNIEIQDSESDSDEECDSNEDYDNGFDLKNTGGNYTLVNRLDLLSLGTVRGRHKVGIEDPPVHGFNPTDMQAENNLHKNTESTQDIIDSPTTTSDKEKGTIVKPTVSNIVPRISQQYPSSAKLLVHSEGNHRSKLSMSLCGVENPSKRSKIPHLSQAILLTHPSEGCKKYEMNTFSKCSSIDDARKSKLYVDTDNLKFRSRIPIKCTSRCIDFERKSLLLCRTKGKGRLLSDPTSRNSGASFAMGKLAAHPSSTLVHNKELCRSTFEASTSLMETTKVSGIKEARGKGYLPRDQLIFMRERTKAEGSVCDRTENCKRNICKERKNERRIVQRGNTVDNLNNRKPHRRWEKQNNDKERYMNKTVVDTKIIKGYNTHLPTQGNERITLKLDRNMKLNNKRTTSKSGLISGKQISSLTGDIHNTEVNSNRKRNLIHVTENNSTEVKCSNTRKNRENKEFFSCKVKSTIQKATGDRVSGSTPKIKTEHKNLKEQFHSPNSKRLMNAPRDSAMAHLSSPYKEEASADSQNKYVDDTCLEECQKEAILGVLQELPEGWLLVPNHTAELVSSLMSMTDTFHHPLNIHASVVGAINCAHNQNPCDKREIPPLNNAHLLLYVALKLCCIRGTSVNKSNQQTHKQQQEKHPKQEGCKGSVLFLQKDLVLKVLEAIRCCEGSFDRLLMCVLLGRRAPGGGYGWYCETEAEDEKVRDLRFVLDHVRLLRQCRVSEVVSAPLWSCGTTPVALAALAESPQLVLVLLQYGEGGSSTSYCHYSKCYKNGVYLAIAYLLRTLVGQLKASVAAPNYPQLINNDDHDNPPVNNLENGSHSLRADLLTVAGNTPAANCLRYLLRAVPQVPAKFLCDHVAVCDAPSLLPRSRCLDPPSLTHLSRIAVRSYLSRRDLLPQVVDHLNVPPTVRDHINLLRD